MRKRLGPSLLCSLLASSCLPLCAQRLRRNHLAGGGESPGHRTRYRVGFYRDSHHSNQEIFGGNGFTRRHATAYGKTLNPIGEDHARAVAGSNSPSRSDTRRFRSSLRG